MTGPERVAAAAEALGLEIAVRRMPSSTRTAEEAAAACGCALGQIVKSLVFAVEGAPDEIRLALVSGPNRLDVEAIAIATGEQLVRADAKRVKAVTGFAIGGIPPFGHAVRLPTLMDRAALAHTTVWAAAGAPNVVFEIAPDALRHVTKANLIDMS